MAVCPLWGGSCPVVVGVRLWSTCRTLLPPPRALHHEAWLFCFGVCSQARTTRNAQKIFRHSLWYLPVVLSLMVYHSKNWDRDRSAVHDVNVRETVQKPLLILGVVLLPGFFHYFRLIFCCAPDYDCCCCCCCRISLLRRKRRRNSKSGAETCWNIARTRC